MDAIVIAAYRGPVIPDGIMLVSAEEDSTATATSLRSDSTQSARDRIEGRAELCYTSINPRTGVATFDSICTTSTDSSRFRKFAIQKTWIKDGIASIFQEPEVLIMAPPGYAFHKPSGESSSFFLKPDLALSSSPIVSFVALSIFLRAFSGDASRIRETKTIYIDTMAISSVAYALRDLLTKVGTTSPVRVDSFHSYGGFDGVHRPIPGASFCLISASSSMSLQRKWITEKSVNTTDVITLVTLGSAQDSEKALHSLALDSDRHSAGPSELSIKIAGENFLPSPEPGSKVLIRAEPYVGDSDIRLMASLAGNEIFDIFRPDILHPGKVRTLHVDGTALFKSELFQSWLRSTLEQFTRATTRCVIYQDDAASRAFATNVADLCNAELGLSVVAMCESEVESTGIHPKAALIICAAVIGKGSKLLQISRMLRDVHAGHRLYLVGFQATETRSEIKTLRSNIRYKEKYLYDFESFGSIAIGTQLLSSFKQEKKLYQDKSNLPTSIPAQPKARAERLREGRPLHSLSLLPSGVDLSTPMKLRTGFAFWPPVYEPGPLQPEVLATIGSILQRAREDGTLKESDRLSSRAYRQILIDPENFSRYNDGLIQSAILRCAYPSELDYRTDYASSDFMKQLVLRSLHKMDREAGEASLEFILAISSGRMKLHKEHLQEVFEGLASAPVSKQTIELLTWILQDASGGEAPCAS